MNLEDIPCAAFTVVFASPFAQNFWFVVKDNNLMLDMPKRSKEECIAKEHC